jgi:hypothetical protein
MQTPLQSHIKFLENTIQNLKNRMTGPGLSVEELEDIELQLSLSESALDHYRQAYELELEISGSEPPNRPAGAEDGGGSQNLDSSNPTKKKGGLVAVRVRIHQRACKPVGTCRVRRSLDLSGVQSGPRFRRGLCAGRSKLGSRVLHVNGIQRRAL